MNRQSSTPANTLYNQEITQLSASQMVQAIARGDLSASEAVEAHIARIERVNPALNAVVVKRYEAARAEAQAADERRKAGDELGLLHGLPVTIKDSLDLTDTPSTFGLPSRANHRASKDEIHVARLRQAGAIALGKTNVSQLLFYYESANPVYGQTNNPWNPARTSGGSSGGEAAIIAGQARYLLGTEEKLAQAGETVILLHGVAHKQPWNAGDSELQVQQSIQLHQPDPTTIQAIERFFETLYGLGEDGKVNKDGLPNPLQFALILKQFQPHAYVAGLPILAQRLLFGLLAGLGRLAGYRTYYPHHSAS